MVSAPGAGLHEAALGAPVEEVMIGRHPGPGGTSAFSISMLLRSKWLILAVFVALSALLIPWIWLLTGPVYQATSLVRVSPVISRIVFKTEDNGMVPLYKSFLNTQVSVIRGPKVLQRVLDNPDVQRTRWYLEPPRTWHTMLGGSSPSQLERLRDALSVQPRRDTELIDVALTAASAAEAKLIVDAVVDAYKKYTDETFRESDILRFETLSNERTTLQKEIDGLVESKFNYAKSLGTLDPEELRSKLATQLSTLEAKEQELERQCEMARFKLEAQEAAVPEHGDGAEGAQADDPETEDIPAGPRYADDPEWRALNLAYENSSHELEVARQRYGESHPRIKQLTADVEHGQHLRQERELDLDAEWADALATMGTNGAEGVVTRAQAEWAVKLQQRELELLRASIKRQQEKVAQAGEMAKRIAHYDEEIRYKRELYDVVRSRLEELEIEAKAPARIAVAAVAIAPSEPFRDRRALLTVMVLGGALCAGIALAYLKGSVDPRIQEAQDVQHTMHVPFLGQLPPLPTAHGAITWNCNPAVLEGIRMVRTALLSRLGDSGDRTVLITSSSSRAGKTSVAIGLSQSLAQLGKRTLLVETDLRAPSLSERLGLEERSVGLAALLRGDADDSQAIERDFLPGLDMLRAGKGAEEFDPELLANGGFAKCLARWRRQYDYVILDSPPVLPVADTRILAGQADGIVMVLRSSHCRRHDVMRAYADIGAAGGRLLGTVLVGVPPGSRYGYGYGYGYGSPEAYRSYYDSQRALGVKPATEGVA